MLMEPKLVLLATTLLEQFRVSGKTVSTAESCTGGLISALLTSVAGSSDVFERGFVTYSNEAKQEMIGVTAGTLEQFGAVSPEVAGEMAAGALRHSRADVAVSVTGIAGPGRGTEKKPVGLVFVAVAALTGIYVEEFRFGDIGRDEVRAKSAQMAMEMLVTYGLDNVEQ